MLRESFTVVQGFESWTKRAWDASTMGVYRRQIKAAEAVGDREELKEWTDRKETADRAAAPPADGPARCSPGAS